jgi:hypothetical protein
MSALPVIAIITWQGLEIRLADPLEMLAYGFAAAVTAGVAMLILWRRERRK